MHLYGLLPSTYVINNTVSNKYSIYQKFPEAKPSSATTALTGYHQDLDPLGEH